jgi:hypothetical protein
MKKEFFEALVKDSCEEANQQVSVKFGNLFELNQCVNAYTTLLQEFSCNAKAGLPKDFYESLLLIQLELNYALEEGIEACQKKKQ